MSKQSAASKALTKAVRAAGKKLRFRRERDLQSMLDGAGFSLADAYRCGAEEAQGAIVSRLSVLSDAAWQEPDPSPVPTSPSNNDG